MTPHPTEARFTDDDVTVLMAGATAAATTAIALTAVLWPDALELTTVTVLVVCGLKARRSLARMRAR